MSPDVPGLVQTSNSLARVLAANGTFEIHTLVRSAVDTEKLDLARAVRCALEPLGGTVEFAGAYPGWIPRPDSAIVKLMSSLYRELFGSDASVLACHAGLECGIVGANYPDLQMISFGPNIRGAHSPDIRTGAVDRGHGERERASVPRCRRESLRSSVARSCRGRSDSRHVRAGSR